MGEDSTVVKKMPNDCREQLRQKPDTTGMRRRPSRAFGLPRLLVLIESKPFKEILTQPSLGIS